MRALDSYRLDLNMGRKMPGTLQRAVDVANLRSTTNLAYCEHLPLLLIDDTTDIFKKEVTRHIMRCVMHKSISRYTRAPADIVPIPTVQFLLIGVCIMAISMHQISIPVFKRVLSNLSAIIDKAAAHAEAKKIDPSVYLTARLAPDMFDFTRQVQIASDTVKGAVGRLAGVDIPSYADTETTFPELSARIAKTLDFVNSVSAAQFDSSEDKTVTLSLRGREVKFVGLSYLLDFVLPNLYFHTTTAYAILRHNGVEIGKMDFLGAP